MLEKTKILEKKDIINFSFDDVIELQKNLEFHSDLYYNKEVSQISDKEYDYLLKKLENLEEKFSIIFEEKNLEKKANKVWSELIESSFKKVAHSRPMISLWNTYNEDDLNDFNDRVYKNVWEEDKKISYTLEFKFDWLWVELIYNKWILIQAITRGNWIEWEDVTQNIMQITNIPKKINYKEYLEIRGEVIMPFSSFDKLNKEARKKWDKVFSNPRNAASWSLRMKDNRVTKKRDLAFFAYDFWDLVVSDYYFDCIKNLEKLWFYISSYFEICSDIYEVIEKIHNFWNIKTTLNFEIDWLVLKVNNRELWEEIWYTQHHPKYAIAYKFPAEVLTTDILSVEHQVWRTWTITPVANLEPINIGWAIIRRATLHNYEECEKLQVWVWDSVFIKRAWEVIPKIIWVANKDSDKIIFPPIKCPSCQTDIIKDEEKVRYYCPNKVDCFEQKKHKLIYAVWKQWLNIDWFWKAQVEQFLKLWFISDLYSIFKLIEKKDDILELEWFQKKSVDNLLNAIEDKKNISITILLISLAISWVGKKTSNELSKLFTSEFDLLNFNYSLEKIEELDDIWIEIAKNMFYFFNNLENKILLNNLVNILNITFYKEKLIENKENIFYLKKVCITWSFWNIKRHDLIKKLEEVWWSFITSVSKNTDFLVAGEKAWSKLKKAEELSIKVLSLEEFLENT
jgi:DNA ligase (NAD+)